MSYDTAKLLMCILMILPLVILCCILFVRLANDVLNRKYKARARKQKKADEVRRRKAFEADYRKRHGGL